MIDYSEFPNFSREVDFPLGDPHIESLRKLQKARTIAGIPFSISSGVRHGDPRAHGAGRAFDIRCSDSHSRALILFACYEAGFRRWGIYDRHVHVDDWPDGPTPRIWTGKSR